MYKRQMLKYIEEQQFRYIIAADSGMEFLYKYGKKPDMIVGDFDSDVYKRQG